MSASFAPGAKAQRRVCVAISPYSCAPRSARTPRLDALLAPIMLPALPTKLVRMHGSSKVKTRSWPPAMWSSTSTPFPGPSGHATARAGKVKVNFPRVGHVSHVAAQSMRAWPATSCQRARISIHIPFILWGSRPTNPA
jgi:hypothetical protein